MSSPITNKNKKFGILAIIFCGFLFAGFFGFSKQASADECSVSCGATGGSWYEDYCADSSNFLSYLIQIDGSCVTDQQALLYSGTCQDQPQTQACCVSSFSKLSNYSKAYWTTSASCLPSNTCLCSRLQASACPGNFRPECKFSGVACSDASQCCFGMACNNGYCGIFGRCNYTAEFCSCNAQCCSGSCVSGQCTGKADGLSCSVGSECQGGYCCNNVCQSTSCPTCKAQYQACPGGTADCCSGLVCWNGVCSNSMTCNNTNCQNTYPGSTYSSCSGCNSGDSLSGTFGSLGCTGQLCSCCSGSSPINYGLTVQKDGTGAGTISSSPVGIDCGTDCFQPYLTGTPVTLTAVASGGSTFVGWSGGGCSGTGNCSLVMSGNTTITATFNTTASLPSLLGLVKVRHPLGILSLRLISFSDAFSFLKGIFKVSRFGGDTNASADLVETTDPNASPVRVKTPYGIKAWRKQ